MDTGSIENVVQKREQHYIWLEKDLKIRVGAGAAVIAVCFLLIGLLNPGMRGWGGIFLAAEVLGVLWNYALYRREYRRYQLLAQYLDAFEEGRYNYHTDENYMKTGIHSQLTEQLERLGNAFGTLKERLVEEKEGTKQLVTDISHQLKTPVSALEISLELMSDGDTTLEEKQEFLERSIREVKKLRHLLGTLTNLSRLEADMIQLCPKEASLKETLVQAASGVWIKASEKEIELEMAEFVDLKVRHDVRWTAEAFSNVIDNAVKYSPKGSRIQIRVEKRISYVFIEIEDEGIGIPQNERLCVFKRFYRGSSPEVAASEGAGVGLYLVRQILEAQGGTVRVIPARKKGSIFQMTLPLSL